MQSLHDIGTSWRVKCHFLLYIYSFIIEKSISFIFICLCAETQNKKFQKIHYSQYFPTSFFDKNMRGNFTSFHFSDLFKKNVPITIKTSII